jgi:hypothetical protein
MEGNKKPTPKEWAPSTRQSFFKRSTEIQTRVRTIIPT